MIDLEKIKRRILAGEEIEEILKGVDWKEFEEFVANILEQHDFSSIIHFRFKTKRFYEIDVLAINEKTKEILACECKWQAKVNAEKVVKELAEKLSYVDWYKEKRKESFAIFAKSFSKKIKSCGGKKVYCFDLKDLQKILKKRTKF